jgi:diguanylate cyclase (GGDEF)-like protein
MVEPSRKSGTSAKKKARELKDNASRIRELWRSVGQGDTAQLAALLELVSALAATGKTAGYPAVARQTARLSQALQEALRLGLPDDLRPLHAGIDKLELELLKATQPHGPTPPAAPRLFQNVERMVFIADQNDLHAEWLEGLLGKANFDTRHFRDWNHLRDMLGNDRPIAIILSVDTWPDGAEDSLPGLPALQGSTDGIDTPRIPLICMSELGEIDYRLRAVRLGVNYFLNKPLDVNTLISLLEDLAERSSAVACKLLFISRESADVRQTIGMLESAGMQVRLLADPAGCLALIDEFHPDIIMINAHFGTCTGVEIACALRQETEFANLPLAVLTDVSAPQPDWPDALQGDTLIEKSLQAEQMITLLRAQVGRAKRVSQYVRHLFREIRYKDLHDTLTGLPNKKQLEKRLELELRSISYGVRKRLALLLIDIDNFQYINDAYGHEGGDSLLVDLSRRLSTFLPERAFISRQGGDEFTVLLVGLNSDSPLEGYLARLMKVCEAPFSIQGDEIRIALSVGATEYVKSKGEYAEKMLFKQADTALFKAKAAGRNGYVIFRSSMDTELKVQITLLSDLRRALEREELFLVYQPQLSLADGELIGAEVLLRWQHPKRGLISPGEFIPLAEAHGLIGELGNFVLRTAIQQIALWQRRFGRTIRLAVNVSPRQFSEPEFVRQVAALLKFAGVEGRWLELEITESALASDLDQAVGKLAQLRALAVTIAIDDFGTGFSNLASLKRYPVDLLKIDRSFVQGLPGEENDVAIVNAIIQLARALGLKLLAEGVETPAQRDYLRAFQCDYVQGFLFARPMPITEFEQIYLNNDAIDIIAG